ncbi:MULTISPECIES: DUF5693 family protein [unclassified Paenibacillus]|uniref:DUF5693 family protein n=1 Tax=unclassified Paenibacillus TaxID=185978 RepID=UPI0009A6DCB6|nr:MULTISPECIES: DUF5693 family protein [unclassified Paenibacillus]SLK06903.1 hypothetical protein SAMN06272722_104353 [Paenibacillus sp. RU5A]SOC70679.1 hypothetical protein SAMN05880581_104353 [Paenibacillus sp. RU26A]SOC72824.1 hypothetical protein SAMN05880586_104353 [Paenibacillus sp. RU5M]
MRQKWLYWNTASRKWLWIVVIIGLIASIPVISDRVQTESSAKKVELVFNYRGLLDISAYQAHPQDFMNEQLTRLKDAGVTTMAVFESTLDELKKSRRLMVYNGQDLANMTKNVIPANDNYTYVLFTNEENAQTYTPIIEQTFADREIPVLPWEYEGRSGLILQTPPENANMQPLQPDPVAVKMLRDKGFYILPRISDSVPYNQESMERLLTFFEENGVKRILFDGDAVKGYNDNAEMKSIDMFAQLLNKHHIGLAAIENLKKPQSGFETLSYKIDYNVTRLYSLSDGDANLDVDTIADRFVLATKDRNIRMIYMNASPSRNTAKAMITNPIDNLINSLGEPGHAIERMGKHGFELGQAEAFTVKDSSIQRYAKLVALIGAIAMISLMVSYFVPLLTLLIFALALVGSAGLFLLKPTLLEQGIALLVAISAPTIAMVLAVRTVNYQQQRQPDEPAGRRLAQTLFLYVRTSILSFLAVPFVIALLNSITYSLVINQFRGVSLLHFAPMALVAIYIVFYRGSGTFSIKQIKNLLRTPITVVMVVLALVAAVVGYYYLSRTGNSGSVTPFEMFLRVVLEDTFGVRPRFKEFMLGHPLFIVGVFAALKYRKVIFVLIIAAIGQLSMVDTFAHIHTPAVLSLIRGVMGLGLGLIFGIVAVGVWQVAEGCWKKWSPLLKS